MITKIYEVFVGDDYETFLSVLFSTEEEANKYRDNLRARGYEEAEVLEKQLHTSYEESKACLW